MTPTPYGVAGSITFIRLTCLCARALPYILTYLLTQLALSIQITSVLCDWPVV